MAFPFASAYSPVDALATRQMQINAAEQARQLEMQRMAQAERQAQLGAALQARQLQDAQAARELQAALSFRQQAAQEAQFGQQLGLNKEQMAANERMAGAQIGSAEKIAGLQFSPTRLDPRVAQANIQRDLELELTNDEIDARNEAATHQAQLDNRKLEKAANDAKRGALNPQKIPFIRRVIPWGKAGDVDVDQLEASLTQILTDSPRDPKGRPLTQYDPESKTFKAVIVPKKTTSGAVILPSVSNPFFGISRTAGTPSQIDQSAPSPVIPMTTPRTNVIPNRRLIYDPRTGQAVPY